MCKASCVSFESGDGRPLLDVSGMPQKKKKNRIGCTHR